MVVRVALVASVLAVGCGRLNFDPARGDGGDGDANGPALRCGTIEILADDFQSTTRSAVWNGYAYTGTSIAQGGGELVATMPAAGAAAAFAGYTSYNTMDLRDARMYAHVTQLLDPATQGVTRLQATPDINNYISIMAKANQLYAFLGVASVQQQIGTVAYDPVAHAWWQLREAQGTVYFETSSDGQTFVPFASVATPAFAASVRTDLSAGTAVAEPNAGAAHFASFNGGTARGQRCSASALRDDFNSGVFGSVWGNSYAGTGTTYAETAGQVVFSLPATTFTETAVDSAMAYDLRESEIFTQVSTMPNATQAHAFLRAHTPANDFVLIEEIQGTLTCDYGLAGGGGIQVCAVPFDAIAHKYWRLRSTSGMVFWETSPDAAMWTTQYSAASPIALDAVSIGVGGGAGLSTPVTETAVFTTFNQLPP